jgi:hypothetical protein
MADNTQPPVNGAYPPHSAYPTEPYTPSHAPINTNNTSGGYQPTQSSTPTNAPINDNKNDIPKDEVGWFFVEQYYTTMSRSPEKLHLFYSRRSQFVSGNEAESVQVVVGSKVRIGSSSTLPSFSHTNTDMPSRPSMRRSKSLTSMIAKSAS